MKYILNLLCLTILVSPALRFTSAKSDNSVYNEVFPIIRRPNSRTPVDCSTIRGANYCYAEYGDHSGMWDNYSEKITERDLGYAQKIGINQIRCFITYQPYQRDRERYRKNLIHLVRAADERGIGVMPVVGYNWQMQMDDPRLEEWAKFLVDALGKEPGLAFWDVYNEPDYPPTPSMVERRTAFARHMAGIFRKLDGQTPVTIGFAFAKTMAKYVDDVDVLVFHNYLETRKEIRTDIEFAKKVAAESHKQVIDDEMGCVARANPYDITIEEHMNARIGFYVWELMIVHNPANGQGWGSIHGIFYPDGTVRDPSIPLAVMGIFRNRGDDLVLEIPDREGKLTHVIQEAHRWLGDPNSTWEAGLHIAEVAANLLESAQIAPMRELPLREVELLRKGQENRQSLKAVLEKDIQILQPYVQPQRPNRTPF
jgi:hypothetical protein